MGNALVRSLTAYGQECFFGSKPTHTLLLEQAELRALRAALSVPPSTSGAKIYAEVQWIPLEEVRRKRCAEYVVRTRLVKDHIMQALLNDSFGLYGDITRNQLLKSFECSWYYQLMSIWMYTKPVVEQAGISLDSIESNHLPPMEPWILKLPNCKQTVETGIKITDSTLAGVIAQEFIDEHYSSYFQIYTDGSVLQDGSSGSGAACKPPDGPFLESCGHQLNPNLSTYSTEINAIYSAMLVVEQYSKVFDKFVILTDSLSAIQALQVSPKLRFNFHNDIMSFLNYFNLRNIYVEIAYVPSHCGVVGNERADQAANAAAKNEKGNHGTKNIGYTRREAYAMLCKSIKNDYQNFPFTVMYNNGKGTFPNLIPNYNILVRRLRVNRCSFQWNDYVCACGQKINLEHIFNSCPSLSSSTENLRKFKTYNNLKNEDFLKEHNTFGWLHAKLLCETIVGSPVAYAFA